MSTKSCCNLHPVSSFQRKAVPLQSNTGPTVSHCLSTLWACSFSSLTATIMTKLPNFWISASDAHRGTEDEMHWEPELAILFFFISLFSPLFICGKAKATPVPTKNKEDLGLFVIKAVCISLRKRKVWRPLGSICKAFSQQTFSHHRQMPSVLQLGVNGFWTANFTAVSIAADGGGMGDFLQCDYLNRPRGARWNSHDEQRKRQYWGLTVQAGGDFIALYIPRVLPTLGF